MLKWFLGLVGKEFKDTDFVPCKRQVDAYMCILRDGVSTGDMRIAKPFVDILINHLPVYISFTPVQTELLVELRRVMHKPGEKTHEEWLVYVNKLLTDLENALNANASY